VGLLLTLVSLYVPRSVRRRKLEGLFAATADAFQTPQPSTRGLTLDECLRRYALFTREQAGVAIMHGTEAQVRARLYRNAHDIGRQLRRDLRVGTSQVMRVGALVYRMLGIDFRGEAGGDIVIRRCFFSDFYSEDACGLISALDEGLLVGLAGGGRLTFLQRITEGRPCCLAHLDTHGRQV